MKPIFTAVIYNPDFSVRWNIEVYEVREGIFEVRDSAEHSLFNNPLALGASLRNALDKFLRIETELINKL